MPLVSKNGASAPKELGLFWAMHTPDGETVDVFIFASALQSFDPDPLGPVGLLKRHRQLLERIASEKYDRDGAVSGLLHLQQNDLQGIETSGLP